jgi:hypothetical protein
VIARQVDLARLDLADVGLAQPGQFRQLRLGESLRQTPLLDHLADHNPSR